MFRTHSERNAYLIAFLIIPALFLADKNVYLAINEFRQAGGGLSGFMDYVAKAMYYLAQGYTLIAISVLVIAAGRHYGDGRLTTAGKSLLYGQAAAGIGAQVIKHIIGRARPRLGGELSFIGPTFQKHYDSFPSGHSASAFCFAAVLSHYYPRYRPAYYAMAVLVGAARIESTSHFPSDVLGSALLGLITAKLLTRDSVAITDGGACDS